jgi:carbonic anhydrase/acetyltransferase-like protein (isoleucine patch superfamily)
VVGAGVVVGDGVVVDAGVVVGDEVVVDAGVVVGDGVVLGSEDDDGAVLLITGFAEDDESELDVEPEFELEALFKLDD